jgi:PST family polysaccharide transporter
VRLIQGHFVILLKSVLQHRVARNAGALVFLQLANYISPLLVLIHLTRVLGLELYGVVAFSMGIVQISYVVLDVGFSLSATQRISVWREKKRYIAKLIGAIFFIKITIFIFLALIVFLFSQFSEKYEAYSNLFLLTLLPVLGQTFQPVWFFSGVERMRNITLFMVSSKVIFVFLIYLLVSEPSDYLWVPVANGVAQISAMAIGIYLIFCVGYQIAIPRSRDVFYALKVTSGFYMSRISVVTYTGSGVVLLGLFATPSAVAVYSLAEQLYKVMQNVFAPINQAIYPYMAKERNFPLFRKLAVGCVTIAALGAVCGYFAAPELIKLVFGSGWDASVKVFNYFLIAIVVNVMAVMSGYPLAAAVGNLRVANSSVAFGSIIYLVCAGLLLLFNEVSPIMFALIMILAESYVLVHRAVVLWPIAYKIEKNNSRN